LLFFFKAEKYKILFKKKSFRSPSPIKQKIRYIDMKRESPPKEEKKIEYSEEVILFIFLLLVSSEK